MIYKFQTTTYTSAYPLLSQKKIEIPALCPNCGVSNNPTTKILITSENFGFLYHHCTACNENHYSIQQNIENRISCKAVYPTIQPSNLPPQVVELSPRFEKMYRDAEFAENNDSIELAGIGYRACLEILLKDYAFKFELDTHEGIAKTNLNNAISKYFKTDVDTQTAADVVRILGNDYAHWEKGEEYDIEMLKSYLAIFIQIINTKLMLKNPPVSRQAK
ncbi:DUF4145 domain-containing protein [Listeria booriae]|uniref:DUF4145 domain-containing protein n=1 Tax=Listeria booriae TaxID=1552123 RepID=UPI002892A3FF|nr:DUF4145 domain-containing protein [Listeria booriae]